MTQRMVLFNNPKDAVISRRHIRLSKVARNYTWLTYNKGLHHTIQQEMGVTYPNRLYKGISILTVLYEL